jgi:hypothetical protein
LCGVSTLNHVWPASRIRSLRYPQHKVGLRVCVSAATSKVCIQPTVRYSRWQGGCWELCYVCIPKD